MKLILFTIHILTFLGVGFLVYKDKQR